MSNPHDPFAVAVYEGWNIVQAIRMITHSTLLAVVNNN